MKCPRCVQGIHHAASSCPHCGFTIHDTDAVFGSDGVRLRKFSDSAGVLRMKEREKLRDELDRFERKFPQLFFSVYLGAFEDQQSLRQFGFWLLNRAAFEDVDLDRPNENGVLLVVDVNAKQAGLTYGYSLLPYLCEDTTFAALSSAHPSFLQGDYLEAIRLTIRRVEKCLVKGWHEVSKDPQSVLARGGQSPKGEVEKLERIREGNRLPEPDAGNIELKEETPV